MSDIAGFDTGPDSEILPPGSLSERELGRRLDESIKVRDVPKPSHGRIKSVESVDKTDYIRFVHANGHSSVVLRLDAILRAKAVLEALLVETASADPAQMEYDVWLCHETFKAIIANGQASGKQYNPATITKFMTMLKYAETSWRSRHDLYRKRKFSGQAPPR